MMGAVVPFRHQGDPDREIDFDLYVELLVIHQGYDRRDAELTVRTECRRDNLRIVRSDPDNNFRRIGVEA
jgi:hypothetical protein